MQTHTPVLLDEALDALQINANGIYVDGTFGRGGHSRHILQRLSPQGRLIAFDKDSDAVQSAETQFADDERFIMQPGSFATMQASLAQMGYLGCVDGILLDLGVSSPQLDNAERGFSFNQAGPLDMRMDQQSGITAEQWLMTTEEKHMAQVFKEYGEERFAKRIAKAICKARMESDITDTLQLAEIVKVAHPAWEKHKHPATRVFQAIRIEINSELKDLRDALEQTLAVLKVGGRLVVISFHSLEDRIVKQFIQKHASIDAGPIDLPIATQHLTASLKKVGKMTTPQESESKQNPRARSARMRVAEKLP